VNKKSFISVAITLALICLVWIILTPIFFPNTQADAVGTAPHRGFYAPVFSLNTPQGEAHSLSSYQDRPVLIFFWASHCSICKSVMPGLEAVYQDYAQQGFEILAINTTNQDHLSAAEAYFQSQGYTFTMLVDQDGSVSDQYQIHAVPTSVIVNPDGKISDLIIGSGISEGFLRAHLDTLFTKGGQ
jgi:peroxiredoxin